MKRRITLSIALALSVVLVSLMSSDSTAKAQPGGLRRIADTGIVTLGPNQIIRLTVVGTGFGSNPDNLCFRRVEYGEGTCNSDGVCKHAISSQIESAMIPLVRGEGASFDLRRCIFPICGGVRGHASGVALFSKPTVTASAPITYSVLCFQLRDFSKNVKKSNNFARRSVYNHGSYPCVSIVAQNHSANAAADR